jgi:hypothetical protein
MPQRITKKGLEKHLFEEVILIRDSYMKIDGILSIVSSEPILPMVFRMIDLTYRPSNTKLPHSRKDYILKSGDIIKIKNRAGIIKPYTVYLG